jgi:hypothetical protein
MLALPAVAMAVAAVAVHRVPSVVVPHLLARTVTVPVAVVVVAVVALQVLLVAVLAVVAVVAMVAAPAQ